MVPHYCIFVLFLIFFLSRKNDNLVNCCQILYLSMFNGVPLAICIEELWLNSGSISPLQSIKCTDFENTNNTE